MNILDERKAQDIVDIDFENTHPLVDAFIVADAPSLRQINALAQDVENAIHQHGFKVKHIEKEDNSPWILIDAYDVIVHIFLTEERSHYNLEKLYQHYIHE